MFSIFIYDTIGITNNGYYYVVDNIEIFEVSRDFSLQNVTDDFMEK